MAISFEFADQKLPMPTVEELQKAAEWKNQIRHADYNKILAFVKKSGRTEDEFAQFLADPKSVWIAAEPNRVKDGQRNIGRKEHEDNGQGTGVELLKVADIASVPLRWLWPGKIPAGKLTLLVGDPGIGKSVMTLDWAARVSIGAPWPDGSAGASPGDAVILSAEDDPADTIRPRLEVAGADLDRIFILKCVKKDGHKHAFSLVDDLEALKECLTRLGGSVRLVVIDPISAYLGSEMDSYKITTVRAVLAPLAEVAATTGVACLAVSHFTKGQGSALNRVQMSIGFTAAARAVWATGKDPKDETGRRRILSPLKMNLAPDVGGISYNLDDCNDIVSVRWGEADNTDVGELVGGPAEETGAREEAIQFLEDLLAEGPMLAVEVFKEARRNGIFDRTLKRAKKDIGVRSRKRPGSRASWEWVLSEQECQEGQESSPCILGPLGTLEGQEELP